MNQAPANDSLWLRVFASLPWGVLYAKAAVLAFLARYVFRFRVSIARDNLSRCFPQASAKQINTWLRAYYRQLGQIAVEFLKIGVMSAQQMRDHLSAIGFEQVRAETAAGRSVILVAAHQCNWEWAFHGTVLQMNVPVDAAYKPLHGQKSDAQLRKLRVRYGANLIAAKRLVREVISRRRQVQVHAVALLADQMPTSSQGRHWVSFLGRDTAFYPGPAEIARMTGYAAFFIAMRRERRGHYTLEVIPICGANERLDPPIFTARYAALIEAQIRASPADWTWIHRRWKGERPADAALATTQASATH
ncbi:MAG TPA: lysophospholipid acyltransferase family protein [Steroidobacteraceae bacterium]|jgi:KDO2-lipid IV(A) lauroyltransferase|nr:lysophospholipid acyltransferase family protein [Steroidobacteraceae bacterium]